MNLQSFKSRIQQINPEGNIDSAHELLLSYITFGKTVDGDPLTFELVIKRYGEYVQSWNYKYAKKAASGFLPKDKELVTIYPFIKDNMYEQQFQTRATNIERDKYLFGDDFNTIYNKVLNAKKTIQREKEKLD